MDSSLVEAFQSQGAVVARGLLEPGWIETLRGVADEVRGRTYDPGERLDGVTEAASQSSDGMWRWCEPFARVLFKSPIGDAAAAVMRSRTVTLYEDLFLYTEPGVEGADWHRDAPHWPIVGRQLSSVWFSLDSVGRDAGALRFVAGSHLDGDSVAAEGLLPAIDPEREGRTVVAFDVEPGDAVVFHPRVLHAARGSAPDQPRRSFTIRFAGDDVRWRPRRAVYHPWMRDAGLQKGDVLDHPWFPVIRRDSAIGERAGGERPGSS